MTKTNKNTLKNTWKKPLAALLSLSILASMSTSCLANEKHEQFAEKMKMKIFNEEDVKGWGWVIASVEASKLGLDEKEVIFKYSKEDLKLIRKLSDFFDTEEKRKQMAWIHNKQKANSALTEEEGLIFEDYDQALAELKKMLRQKTETSSADVNADEAALYRTKGAEEADAFYSNEENQKLISSSLKSSAKLSKEEEEALNQNKTQKQRGLK